MATEIIPPKRSDKIVEADATPTYRATKFFEEIAEGMTAVADVATGTVDPDLITIENKINELLAAMRSKGALKT